MREQSLDFLRSLVVAASPSGFEREVAELYRNYVRPYADRVTTDVMGNVTASINPDAKLRFMYAGHMDEIGFIVHYIDPNGFLHFNSIGGTDVATEIGQRVWVHGSQRVEGVIGRRAIQTFQLSDSKSRRCCDWAPLSAATLYAYSFRGPVPGRCPSHD